jgi:hypothetical protein
MIIIVKGAVFASKPVPRKYYVWIWIGSHPRDTILLI